MRWVNLLLISKKERQHYCLINNISRLLSSQTPDRHGKKIFCLRCLNSFSKQQSLDEHQYWCKDHSAVRIDMPKEEHRWLSFYNHNRKVKLPFVIYADFESLIVKTIGNDCNTTVIKCNFDDRYSKLVELVNPKGYR